MIKTKSQVYNDPRWIRKADHEKAIKLACERCGSTKHLICHHVIPLQWKDGKLDVEDFEAEIIDVPTEVLCHSCHQGMERSGDAIDYAKLIARGLI